MKVALEIIEGRQKGKVFSFSKPDCFLFGRARDAHISLPEDPYVSRQHFMLEIAPPECKITDMGSKNGTIVNSICYGASSQTAASDRYGAVKSTFLKHGDEIRVGGTILKISIDMDATADTGADPTLQAISKESAAEEMSGLKRYHILEEIGRGGMGIVYRAVDRQTDGTVAIKTMHPQMAVSTACGRAFLREVDVNRQLKHPNIVELLDSGKMDEGFFLVLEYVDGMDLKKFMHGKGGIVSLSEFAPLMLDILSGLAFSHRERINVTLDENRQKEVTGIVHRDLKPPNILLKRTEKGFIPKIADFGLAKSFESAGMTNMTIPGQIAGTPTYWPREQITHYRYLSPPTDVFSAAAVFYEALTGHYVRNGFSEMLNSFKSRGQSPGLPDYMQLIAKNPPVPVRSRNSHIPVHTAAVLDKALSETAISGDYNSLRDELALLRFPDAGAFRDELLQALAKDGIRI